MREGQRGVGGTFLRFALVGVFNTTIDLAVFALLVAASMNPLAANILAWAAAVSFSYLVNARWTFARAEGLSHVRSFLRFAGSGALISLGVSSLAIVMLSQAIGVWPAKILGVAIATALNFVAARWSIENRLR
jgi:putative flippase GtrA